jgi:hypothetical protein
MFQVTTIDGSQFVCLNISDPHAAAAAGPFLAQNSSSVSTPVRQLQPQFAQPIIGEN